MDRIKHPPIIDIEASGFGADSYPIEIGVVLADGEKYCSLISPQPDWTHWDQQAENIHHISRDTLENHGTPIEVVAESLNELLEGKTLYSDGWVVDKPWLIKLFHAAGKPMLFHVSPLELILSEEQMERWHATKETILNNTKVVRHRASQDAWIIQQTYEQTLQQPALN